MKIGFFADPHYCRADVLCRTRRPRLSLCKIERVMEAFCTEGAELAVCLGDFLDQCGTRAEAIGCLDEIGRVIGRFPIPFRLIPGNHDYLDLTPGDFASRGYRFPRTRRISAAFV